MVGSAGRAIEWAGLLPGTNTLMEEKGDLIESSRLPGTVARCGVTVA